MFDNIQEENIRYKLVDNEYHFCRYDITGLLQGNDDSYTYSICYNEGVVGTIPEAVYWEVKDPESALILLKDLLETYNIKKIQKTKVELVINLADILGNLSYLRKFQLCEHINRTIDFASKNSGLGIRNFETPFVLQVLEFCEYRTIVAVANIIAFKELFIELISHCGIRADEVEVRNITLNVAEDEKI